MLNFSQEDKDEAVKAMHGFILTEQGQGKTLLQVAESICQALNDGLEQAFQEGREDVLFKTRKALEDIEFDDDFEDEEDEVSIQQLTLDDYLSWREKGTRMIDV